MPKSGTVQGVDLLLISITHYLKNGSNLISSPRLEEALRKGPLKKKQDEDDDEEEEDKHRSAGVTWIFQPVFGEPCLSPFNVFVFDTDCQRDCLLFSSIPIMW